MMYLVTRIKLCALLYVWQKDSVEDYYVNEHAAQIRIQLEQLKLAIMKKEETRALKKKKEIYKRTNTSIRVGRTETTRSCEAM